jgi:hypothetical protein
MMIPFMACQVVFWAMDGSKVMLCDDGNIRVLEWHEWSIELEGNSQHDLSRRWLDLNFLHCMVTAFPVGQRWWHYI